MARYPALSRLRQDRAPGQSGRSEASPAGILSGAEGILRGIGQRVRHEWEWRSTRFLAGFVFFICSVLLFIASIIFLLGTIYTGIHLLTGSQIASLGLMFIFSCLAGFYFMSRALRKIGESVDFDNKGAPEIID